MKKRRIPTVYLDNAATTFPKPKWVITETDRILRYGCGNPGRSSHRLSMRAAETVYECRRKIADLFGGNDENVIFTSSATHALNLGIKTTLHKGEHILISDIEHNSVIRPVSVLAERGLITFDIYEANTDPAKVLSSIKSKLRTNTSAVITCHRSNICNLLQPIEHIGEFCRNRGIIFLVDASQSAGSVEINMEKEKIDILCAPGHKGLYGIPGSGFVIFGDRFSIKENDRHAPISTFIEGGNGIRSRDTAMPDFLPERLEAGTLAVPAIGALSAGIDFVNTVGTQKIAQHERKLYQKLSGEFTAFNGKIRIYGDGEEGGILLFNALDIPSEELAEELNSFGICVRAGLHCAPTAHKKLKTPEDGAVRVSFGAFNTVWDVNYLLNAIDIILKKRR